MYMGVYAAIGVVAALCSCYSIWVMAVNMISKSALALHANLLDTVIRAPFSYFTSTTTGSLINRFGEDMELIDMACRSIWPTILRWQCHASSKSSS